MDQCGRRRDRGSRAEEGGGHGWPRTRLRPLRQTAGERVQGGYGLGGDVEVQH